MIAIDTNLLVYAHREDSPFHDAALACITACAEGRAAWALPWPCVHGFFSIVTHPRIYAPPTLPDQALDQIDAWLESPSLVLLAKARLAGPAVHDARIAALCLQHGVQALWTADRDFGRFPALRTVNPLLRD